MCLTDHTRRGMGVDGWEVKALSESCVSFLPLLDELQSPRLSHDRHPGHLTDFSGIQHVFHLDHWEGII
jgi:hypothetical protein